MDEGAGGSEPWPELWGRLQSQGWTVDETKTKPLYFPPGVEYRKSQGEPVKRDVDYFHSKKMVRGHLSAAASPRAAGTVAVHCTP